MKLASRSSVLLLVMALVALALPITAVAATVPTINSLTVPATAGAGSTFSVSASASPSTGAGRTITTYKWTCGKCRGTTIKTGASVTFVAPLSVTTTNQTFGVKLKVTDSAGKYVSVTRKVTLVKAMAGTVFTIPTTGIALATIAVSAEPTGTAPFSCKWQAGLSYTATGLSANLKMPNISGTTGSTTVYATCKDAVGNSVSTKRTVALTTGFTVDFGDQTGFSGRSGARFPVSANIVGAAGLVSCKLTFNSGTINNCSGSFTLPTVTSATDYLLTLTVKDGMLRVRTATRAITVNPPRAASLPPTQRTVIDIPELTDGDSTFTWPTNMTVDGAGNVITLTSDNSWTTSAIQRFTPTGDFDSRGDDGSMSANTNFVAVDPSGNVFALELDWNRTSPWKIFKFGPTGLLTKTFTLPNPAAGTGHGVQDLAVDGSGRICALWTSDNGPSSPASYIDCFNASGTRTRTSTPAGQGPSVQALSLAFDQSGNKFLTFIDGHAARLDANGAQTATWSLGGTFSAGQIAADLDGSVYVAPLWSDGLIRKFAGDGTPLTSWSTGTLANGASDIAVDGDGNVFVLDGQSVVKYSF